MGWTMQSLMDLATGYWRSAALTAAVELGLFEAMAGAGTTAAEAAGRADAAPRHTRQLLDALVAMGLAAAEGGRYRLDPEAARFLDPASPACLLGALRYNAGLYPLWGRLAQGVRTGAPVVPPHTHLGEDPQATRRFAMGMHSRALGLAPHLLPAIEPPDPGTLLDVGAGPGTFSRMLAERHAGVRVTQLDLAPVLAVARELAASSPAAGRLTFAEADYRAADYGGPYDAALYCGALHQESPETAAAVMRRIAAAVCPGGRVWVVDLMLDDGGTGPLFPCLFSLGMSLTSPMGRVFEAGEAGSIIEGAGFRGTTIRRLTEIPYTVITAVRA